MFRIDVPTAAGVVPVPSAAGTPGYFTNGNPSTSTPSTVVDADWLNMVQEELVNVVLAAPGPPVLSKTTRTQVRDAITALIAVGASASSIQAQAGNYAAAGGTANALTATFTPAISSHIVGAPLHVKIATTNTAAASVNPGPGIKSIVQPDGSALVGGELKAGAIAVLMYDGTNYQFLGLIGAGRLLKVEVFTANGTWTKDARCNAALFKAVGGGGAGGGCVNGGANAGSAGGGGGAGGFAQLYKTAPASTYGITIGAAGAAVSGANGGNGGNTTVGAILTANGGAGGIVGTTSTSGDLVNGGAGGTAASGDINITGGNGLGGVSMVSPSSVARGAQGGHGGSNALGSGGVGAFLNASGATAGSAASAAGGGGGGAAGMLGGAANTAGGNGAVGMVIAYSFS